MWVERREECLYILVARSRTSNYHIQINLNILINLCVIVNKRSILEKVIYVQYIWYVIRGGLSNLLYLCTVSDKVKLKECEQRQVLVRLYGQIIQENPETVLTDSVIFALLAEKEMGPKLYGVFTGGRVEEYVPVGTFTPRYDHF